MAVQRENFIELLIFFIHYVTNSILDFVLGWVLGPRRKVDSPLTKQQKEIVTKSAIDLANLIREKKLTSYEVVLAYYNHIKNINLQLNAVVDGPFMEALEQAKEIDESLKLGKYSEEELLQKPFLGVPFTTKDSTSVSGKLYTLGLVSRRNARSTEDAECIRLMKESGAIIIATSNVPEVCKWIESRNMLIGCTNNPYDLRRSVGGSSGGEAALISACGTAFGLGTDIGGSIRIPAFCCGIFGHKPTINAVNMAGCTFRNGEEKDTMVVAGPMCKYAKDLMPIFKVIVEPTLKTKLKLDEAVNVKKLKYYYLPNNKMNQCNPVGLPAQNVMSKVRQHFYNLTGKPVELATLPHLKLGGKMWRYWMTQEPADFNLLLGNGVPLNPFVELFKKLLFQSEYTMASIYSLIDSILPSEQEDLMKEATKELKLAFDELLGDDGILFFHSSPRSVPFRYYPLFKFNDFHYFSIFNVLHVPATQVPMGLDENGLPLGIQVVSTKYNDRLCLAVAKELEDTFGGWTSPFS